MANALSYQAKIASTGTLESFLGNNSIEETWERSQDTAEAFLPSSAVGAVESHHLARLVEERSQNTGPDRIHLGHLALRNSYRIDEGIASSVAFGRWRLESIRQTYVVESDAEAEHSCSMVVARNSQAWRLPLRSC